MPSLEAQLETLNAQIANAQQVQARAQVEKENAERDLAAAMKALEEEFNVTTVEAAEELAERLETGMAAAIEKAKAALEESKG